MPCRPHRLLLRTSHCKYVDLPVLRLLPLAGARPDVTKDTFQNEYQGRQYLRTG
jgi:hypothetical protein